MRVSRKIAMKCLSARYALPCGTRRQSGVYAIEFAFVFLMFFGLIYAIICYAILFTFRFGLQNAAEDGARAALRYQVSLQARQDKAVDVARARTKDWLPVKPSITADIIYYEGARCGLTLAQRCQVVVKVTANGLNEVLPPFPNFAMPNQLSVQASAWLDGRSL